jgi:hypothetical protein
MPKAAWFLFGFLFALALGGLLVVLPMRGIRATGATAIEAPAPAPEEPLPAPTPARAGLVWSRQGGLDPVLGACSRLEIDAAWQIHYAPCGQGARLAYFTEGELAWYQAYITTLAPFTHTLGEMVSLAFEGQGSRAASAQERAALADWAQGVYARVIGEEQRANLLAQARLDLMARRGVGLEAIQVIELAPVRWPDACLGLRQAGMDCARVRTEGYRIVLAAEGETFEYRTDAYGQVRAVAADAPHLVLPPLAP